MVKMIKIAELYEGAKAGDKEKLDLVFKMAYVFGERQTVGMLASSGIGESVKIASVKPVEKTGIVSVIKAAGAGSAEDMDFLEKLAEVDSVGVDGIEKMAKEEEIEEQREKGIGLNSVIKAAVYGSKEDIDFLSKLASIEEIDKEKLASIAVEFVEGETEKKTMKDFIGSIIGGW